MTTPSDNVFVDAMDTETVEEMDRCADSWRGHSRED